jgi:hypothetical protein
MSGLRSDLKLIDPAFTNTELHNSIQINFLLWTRTLDPTKTHSQYLRRLDDSSHQADILPLGQDRERTVPSQKTNRGFAVVWARGI